jgi:hypothetical protein
MMITFILFYNIAQKAKYIHYLRKKEDLVKKWRLNILENAFQQFNIYIRLIHQSFIEI